MREKLKCLLEEYCESTVVTPGWKAKRRRRVTTRVHNPIYQGQIGQICEDISNDIPFRIHNH